MSKEAVIVQEECRKGEEDPLTLYFMAVYIATLLRLDGEHSISNVSLPIYPDSVRVGIVILGFFLEFQIIERVFGVDHKQHFNSSSPLHHASS